MPKIRHWYFDISLPNLAPVKPWFKHGTATIQPEWRSIHTAMVSYLFLSNVTWGSVNKSIATLVMEYAVMGLISLAHPKILAFDMLGKSHNILRPWWQNYLLTPHQPKQIVYLCGFTNRWPKKMRGGLGSPNPADQKERLTCHGKTSFFLKTFITGCQIPIFESWNQSENLEQ